MTLSGAPASSLTSSAPAMPSMPSGLPASSTNNGAMDAPNIKVYCRLRQQNQLEKREGATACSTVVDQRTIFLRNERCDVDEIRCTFDRVFDVDATQHDVYEHTAKSLVADFLQGANCTIFAYGQTGSGKTHTILGPKDGVLVTSDDADRGIIARVIQDLFRDVVDSSNKNDTRAATAAASPPLRRTASTTTTVTPPIHTTIQGESVELSVSFVEIYMEQIRDLLVTPSIPNSAAAASSSTSGGLKIRENAQRGIFIDGMTHVRVATADATMALVNTGTMNRAVSSTRMNKDSSRSHSILILTAVRPASSCPSSSTPKRSSTMLIVDLAGSELVNKTNASGKVLQEAKAINKSLSALSNVIKALVQNKKHVPYRDSKLTRILQDKVGGSAKTCLILAASCSAYNLSETISTLRFGLRAKELKNPVVIAPPTSASGTGRSGESLGSDGGGMMIFKELYQQAIEELEAKNKTIDELQRLLAAMMPTGVDDDDDEEAEAEAEAEEEEDGEAIDVNDAQEERKGDNEPSDSGERQKDEAEALDDSQYDERRWQDAEAAAAARNNEERLLEHSAIAMNDERPDDDVVSSDDDDDDDDAREEADDEAEATRVALALALEAKDELTQRTMALADENKRLFHVLETLERQLDDVVVDFSVANAPVLRLRAVESLPPSAIEDLGDAPSLLPKDDDRAIDRRPSLSQSHLLSLKLWLQSGTWQQTLESELMATTPPLVPLEADVDLSTASASSPNRLRGESVRVLDSVENDANSDVDAPTVERSNDVSLSLAAAATELTSSSSSSCSTMDVVPCVHHVDAEALSRQIVALKLQLHYVSESTKQALEDGSGDSSYTHTLVLENAALQTRVDELEFDASLATVASRQLEREHCACETRLRNQETHITCLQHSLQEYQGLFKQQIIMSQEKCRLLTDELAFYKKLATASASSSNNSSGLAATLAGSSSNSAASPPKTKSSPSPRKHRSNSGSKSSAASAAQALLTKPNAVSTMLFPELEHEMSPSRASTNASSSSSANAFGLWRSFESLYKPTTDKTSTVAPGSDVEIELTSSPRSIAARPATVMPLSISNTSSVPSSSLQPRQQRMQPDATLDELAASSERAK